MIASKLQRTRIDSYLRAFGYGKKTALDFPGEAPGILLDKKNWSDTSIATIPTGNGIAVTPIQMLSVYMTIANGGLKLDPKLVKSVVDEKEAVVYQNEKNVPGYSVAGKTGTARKAPYTANKHIASFAGFAPASNPRIAIIVILDEPEGQIYGGTVAAPVFSRLMSSALRVVGVTPDRPNQGLSITNTITTTPINQSNTVSTLPLVKPITKPNQDSNIQND